MDNNNRLSFPSSILEEGSEKKTVVTRFRSESDAPRRLLNHRHSRPLSLIRSEMEGKPLNRPRTDSTLKSLLSLKNRGHVQVTRPIYNHVEFDELHGNDANTERRPTLQTVQTMVQAGCGCSADCAKKFFWNRVPCLGIMKSYKWKEWLSGDLIAGLTVGIMQLPQGMAYALLANLPPIYGLYVSFFPALIYFIFGTSRHINVGTFAVICLMVGEVVERNTVDFKPSTSNTASNNPMLVNFGNMTGSQNVTYNNITGNPNGEIDIKPSSEEILFKVGIATGVALFTGLWQLVMGACRFGFVTIYLGDPLVSGFTTGAAVHVLTSQIKYIFGIKIQRFSGILKIPKTYKEIFMHIGETNPAAVITAAICILMLVVVKEVINPKVKPKIKAPVPIELIVVVLGTIVSYFGKFETEFNVLTVGDIPTGIPAPQIPGGGNLGNFGIIIDSFAIAVVAFAISVSMGKLLAEKQNLVIKPNQELIAFGFANVFGSFFNCFPCCASLSRSLVQENVGGKTQLASVLSCILILIVLLALGPLFESLPNAVLASIILVALKGMFMQFKELKRLWSICKYDFAIWLITWLAVVLLGVDLGLAIGVGFSLLTVVFRTQRPAVNLFGRVPHTDIYRSINQYKSAREITGIKIINFMSALYYANAEHFRSKVYSLSEANPLKIKAARMKMEKKNEMKIKEQIKNGEVDMKEIKLMNGHKSKEPEQNHLLDVEKATSSKSIPLTRRQSSSSQCHLHHIIIDCSLMGYIDSVGVKVFSKVIKEYKDIGVIVFLSNIRGGVREMLDRSGFYDNIPREILYITTHDAVLAALHKRDLKLKSEVEIDARSHQLTSITDDVLISDSESPPDTPLVLRASSLSSKRSPLVRECDRNRDSLMTQETDSITQVPLVMEEDQGSLSVFEEADV